MTLPARRPLACVLGVIVAIVLGTGSARAAAGPAPLTEAQAQQIGADAYVYGIPLLEFQRQRATQTSVTVPNNLSDAPINQLGNQRKLADAGTPGVRRQQRHALHDGSPRPSQGPARPARAQVTHHRYYVLRCLDPYTNVFHYVGTRTTGDGAGNFVIVGPRFHAKLPAGLQVIRAAYNEVWLCVARSSTAHRT